MAPRWLTTLVLATFATLIACGPPKVPPALTAAQPTPTEIADVRRVAAKILDATESGLQIANDTGKLLAALPIADSTKDRFDCAVLRVVGVNGAPSPTVAQVCGPLPTLEAAPLRVALTHLRAVTTCPSLRATTAEILGAVDPLIIQLGLDGNPSLGFAAASLRTVFSYARSFLLGGGQCSQ